MPSWILLTVAVQQFYSLENNPNSDQNNIVLFFMKSIKNSALEIVN